MTVYYKQGVVGDLYPKAQKALGKIAKLYSARGEDLFITSIRDGNHSAGSFHYIGLAFDFRKARTLHIIKIKEVLGADYDVIEHSTHIHVEYDPK